MLHSLFYITQLQVESTILNTCLSAPRLRNKRSQKDFSSQSSKMTLVIRISGSCHAGGEVDKKLAGFYHQPFHYPSKAQDLERSDPEDGRKLQRRKQMWGVGVRDRRQLEILCSVPSPLLLHSHILNTSLQVLHPERPETEGLITGNR